MKGKPMLQKALAFAVFLKFKLGRSSLMRNYSINKIHTLTRISPTTINKYMPILKENGWVKFDGKRQQHLIVCKIASHCEGRNICIDRFCYKSFKDVYRSLRSFLALIIQSHKDYIKRTIQIATNPKKGQNLKAARKKVKRLVKKGILNGLYVSYKEYGLSLKRIAKETGNCVRTAQNIMQYAIKHRWCKKQHNFERFRANFGDFSSKFIPFKHSFLRNGYLYVFHANTYSLSKGITKNISSLDWVKP